MEVVGEEQLRQREVEYPDGVLHQDVLVAQHPAFHSAAVCAVADRADIAGAALVAAHAGVFGIAAGLHGSGVCHQLEPCPQMRARHQVLSI